MKKKLTLLLTLVLSFILSITAFGVISFADVAEEPTPANTTHNFISLTPEEMLQEMGMGWNLGNTMDAGGSEGAWGAPITTKAMIKAVHDYGYNTIRVPVTWTPYISEEDYSVNPIWVNRVQDIVDYAIDLDMYVMINAHHDGAENGGWLQLNNADWAGTLAKFGGMWTSIATYFKDYDEHLIFMGMNEVTHGGTDHINDLNQTFVDAVRQTGGNNSVRWLSVTSQYNTIPNLQNSAWVFPSDNYCTAGANRLMVESHYYGGSSGAPGNLKTARETVDAKARAAGVNELVPHILGEFGFVSGTENDFGATNSARGFELTVKACKLYHSVPVIWDTPGKVPNTLFDRDNVKPGDASMKGWKYMARGMYTELTDAEKTGDFSGFVINSDPEIVPITSITTEKNTVYLKLDQKYWMNYTTVPAETNDIVIWKSADDSVATTHNGLIRARGTGVTTITAYAQDGTAETTVKVIVSADPLADTTSDVCFAEQNEDGAITVPMKGSVRLTPYTTGNSNDVLIYASSNTGIFTVGKTGKIYAVAMGTAYLTVTATNGYTETFTVNVVSPGKADHIDVALYVLWDSSKANNEEEGTHVSVTGNGEYTVSFDLNTQLSDLGRSRNITQINNLTSMYVCDKDTKDGKAQDSPIADETEIRFTNIVARNNAGDEYTFRIRTGEELATCREGYQQRGASDYYSRTTNQLTSDGFKLAKKTDGIFNSNDPFNGWDGCVVDPDEINITGRTNWNPSVTFTKISNITYFEVTFEVRSLEFTEPTLEEGRPATALLDDNDDGEITVKARETVDVSAFIAPANTTSKVSFVSSDTTVAVVDSNAAVDIKSALATVTVTGIKPGNVTITAMADNGLTVEIPVTVTVNEDIADKEALTALYLEVKDTENEGYTDTTYDAFLAAVNNAKAVIDNDDATQDDVDTAFLLLTAAYEGLAYPTDFSVLIEKYNEFKDNVGNYTDESFAAFLAAVQAAADVIADEDATQDDVDEALENLLAAYEGLELKTDEPTSGEPTSGEPTSDEPGTDEPADSESGCFAGLGTYSSILFAIVLVAALAVVFKKRNSVKE